MHSSEAGSKPKPIDVPLAIGTEIGKPWTHAKFRALVRGALRQIYFRWPGRKIALKKARIEKPAYKKDGSLSKRPEVWYMCEICAAFCKEQAGKSGKYLRAWVDHIEPVVPVDRPHISWDEFVDRLFCHADNFQILCDTCHRAKSKEENAKRMQILRESRDRGRDEPTSTGGTDRSDSGDRRGV